MRCAGRRGRSAGKARSRFAPREGVTELIAEAKEAGLALAVASSSTFAWVNGHLDRLGLLSSFDALCTRDDVEETKPNPALYQLAVERLGVEPQEAFAIEDSPNGVTAAKAAGLRCVAAPEPAHRGHGPAPRGLRAAVDGGRLALGRRGGAGGVRRRHPAVAS